MRSLHWWDFHPSQIPCVGRFAKLRLKGQSVSRSFIHYPREGGKNDIRFPLAYFTPSHSKPTDKELSLVQQSRSCPAAEVGALQKLPAERRERLAMSTATGSPAQAWCCFGVLFVRLQRDNAKANNAIHQRLIRERSPLVICSRIILQRAQF